MYVHPALAAIVAFSLGAQAPDAATLATRIAETWTAQGDTSAQQRQLGLHVASLTVRIRQEKDSATREVLLVARLHQLEEELKTVKPGVLPNEATNLLSTLRLSFLLEAAQSLSPDSPAFKLILADPKLMLDLAWHRSGGGFAQQREDEAARKAFAFMDEAAEKQTDPKVKAMVLAAAAELWTRPENVEGVKGYVAKLEKLDPIHPRLKAFKAWIADQENAVAHPKVAVGKAVPAFAVPDLLNAGKVLTPASFKGKYLLIDFWATWCSPCKKELPFLHKAFERFHKKGLEVLSISRDKAATDITTFRKKADTPMPWHHSFPQGKAADDLMNTFRVKGIPHILLVGPDGRVLELPGEALRSEQLEKTLEKHLGR